MADGGSRVPSVWWAPGRIPAGITTSELACTLDVLPTFAHLAGAPLPSHTIDGIDIWPMLTTPGAKSPRDSFYFYDVQLQYRAEEGRPQPRNSMKAVRSGRWKLYLESLRPTSLYDLYSDVSETHDLRARNAAVVDRLVRMATAFDTEINAHIRPLGRLP